MYCESCGSFVPDGQAFCTNCGAPVSVPASPVISPAGRNDQTGQPSYQQPAYQQPAYQQPVYQQPVYQQPVPPVYSQPQPIYQQPVIITRLPMERKRINGAATAGLILGILSLAICWLPGLSFIPSLLGLLFSIIGAARKNAGGKGRAIAGLIMSGIGLLIAVLYLFVMFSDYYSN